MAPESPFETFWQAYPRKVGKGAARAVWGRLRPSASLLAQMLATLEWQRQTDQWRRDGGCYIPHPVTWLRQERWDDEPVSLDAAPAAPHWQDACQHVPRCEDHRQHSWRMLKDKTA